MDKKCKGCELVEDCENDSDLRCGKLEYQEPIVADNLDHSASECLYCAVIVCMAIIGVLACLGMAYLGGIL